MHGGVTFSRLAAECKLNGVLLLDGVHPVPKDWWVIGFDTCHSGDTPERWTKEAVIAETRRLNVELSK